MREAVALPAGVDEPVPKTIANVPGGVPVGPQWSASASAEVNERAMRAAGSCWVD
jgi:hypothetical protein